MERMSFLDAEFLAIEDHLAHMHIAGCNIFEGPAPAYDDVLGAVRSALPNLRRYRQRVKDVPLGLGRPVWVDDPHFNLEYHLRHTALPAPGADSDLRALVGRLMSQPLDRQRPLWELWVVEGLEGGRWALMTKVHHCMVDGVSGADLAYAILETERGAGPAIGVSEDDWRPSADPAGLALVLDAWAGLVGDSLRVARKIPGTLIHPSRFVAGVRRLADGLAMVGRVEGGGGTHDSSIDGSIGPHRRYDWCTVALDDLKAVKDALGGTVNDVVLAAITRGFRELLLSRGELADGLELRSLVPVSMRPRDEHGGAGNRVSALFVRLPVTVEDPAERLAGLRRQMDEMKESEGAEAGDLVTNAGDFAPPFLMRLATQSVLRIMNRGRVRPFDTVTTNVPGPQIPLYSLGREMIEWLPFVPIAQGMRIGVAILSYNGKVTFGVTGDYDTTPDIAVLVHGIEEGLRELQKLAGQAPQGVAPTG
ncbi:MAG: putative diacylglycerol O-acyltransferase tgs1 [Acidimicrobiales bacterium]|nr:MAG: wax ester/triacylglycerol synthase family O-acyltransferase [Actinomycetota bacterium]MBV6509451.1 putative diacylglycerol O-acyltransferase tgs1 [Acidimicrobiales bacterium]RIK06767.1 MAG: wax ester/triacylglycerol synthase family O-acyltransferase [Acidobacteriota bacterium]